MSCGRAGFAERCAWHSICISLGHDNIHCRVQTMTHSTSGFNRVAVLQPGEIVTLLLPCTAVTPFITHRRMTDRMSYSVEESLLMSSRPNSRPSSRAFEAMLIGRT